MVTAGKERGKSGTILRVFPKDNLVILEGINLAHVKEGSYTLVALPLSIPGSDGAPCRAVLVEGTVG